MRVVDPLEVVDVEHQQRERMGEALRARRLLGDEVAEAALVGEAREVVGHRLLGDQLVEGDVLDRGRGLADEIAEDVALGGIERALPAARRT